MSDGDRTPATGTLRELAVLFTKLGAIGFGGPAAHIAMMREEVVRRRTWMTDGEFMDLVGACNLVPGPNSTELAIHIGHRRAGWRGLLVAGCCFIVPAVVVVLTLAVLYDRYGTTAAVVDLRYGVLPVIVAIVVQAIVGLARTAVTGLVSGALAAGTVIAWLAGTGELPLLLVGAVVGALWRARADGRLFAVSALVLGGAGRVADAGGAARAGDVDLVTLGLVFLKVGALLYGSGYVLIAYLRHDLVDRLGWLTDVQLLDAVAVGQVTPGPLFTTATFVGYQVAGPGGAAVATVAIFLRAFVFVAAIARIVPLVQRSVWARGALDGVNAVSLGLMAAVTVRLAGSAFTDVLTVVLGAAAAVVAVRWRPNTAWLVAAGAVVGLGRSVLG